MYTHSPVSFPPLASLLCFSYFIPFMQSRFRRSSNQLRVKPSRTIATEKIRKAEKTNKSEGDRCIQTGKQRDVKRGIPEGRWSLSRSHFADSRLSDTRRIPAVWTRMPVRARWSRRLPSTWTGPPLPLPLPTSPLPLPFMLPSPYMRAFLLLYVPPSPYSSMYASSPSSSPFHLPHVFPYPLPFPYKLLSRRPSTFPPSLLPSTPFPPHRHNMDTAVVHAALVS